MSHSMITTLNIEASSIRFLTVKGRRVERWGNVPLPPGLVKDTVVADPVQVGTMLGELFTLAGISKSGVVVSLTGLRTIFRILTLPKTRGASQMKEAVHWAAKRELPIPLEELHLSWQTIGDQDGEQRVFVLGTPRSLLDTFSQALSKAGIKPHAVELKPLALTNLANQARAAIVDLERDSTSIVILVDGVPEVMHTLVTRQGGLALEDRLQKLAEDLSRTIGFHRRVHPEHSLDSTTPILLTGEVAGDPSVLDLVRRSTGRSIEFPQPALECPPDLLLPQYAVNIGLALRELRCGKLDEAGTSFSCPIKLDLLRSEHGRWWQGATARSLPSVLIMLIGQAFRYAMSIVHLTR